MCSSDHANRLKNQRLANDVFGPSHQLNGVGKCSCWHVTEVCESHMDFASRNESEPRTGRIAGMNHFTDQSDVEAEINFLMDPSGPGCSRHRCFSRRTVLD